MKKYNGGGEEVVLKDRGQRIAALAFAGMRLVPPSLGTTSQCVTGCGTLRSAFLMKFHARTIVAPSPQ
jgi:hypothetical protein